MKNVKKILVLAFGLILSPALEAQTLKERMQTIVDMMKGLYSRENLFSNAPQNDSAFKQSIEDTVTYANQTDSSLTTLSTTIQKTQSNLVATIYTASQPIQVKSLNGFVTKLQTYQTDLNTALSKLSKAKASEGNQLLTYWAQSLLKVVQATIAKINNAIQKVGPSTPPQMSLSQLLGAAKEAVRSKLAGEKTMQAVGGEHDVAPNPVVVREAQSKGIGQLAKGRAQEAGQAVKTKVGSTPAQKASAVAAVAAEKKGAGIVQPLSAKPVSGRADANAEEQLLAKAKNLFNQTLGADWFEKTPRINFTPWNNALGEIQAYVKNNVQADQPVMAQLITANNTLIAAINNAMQKIFDPHTLNQAVANNTLKTMATVAQEAKAAQAKASSDIVKKIAGMIFIAANDPGNFNGAYEGVKKSAAQAKPLSTKPLPTPPAKKGSLPPRKAVPQLPAKKK